MRKQTLVVAIVCAFALLDASRVAADETAGAASKDSTKAGPNAAARQRAIGASLVDLQLSFKMDPRFTRSLYMGDRWISPPTHTRVGDGKECVVETRVYGLTGKGQTVIIKPNWTSADPEIVSVSPSQGNEVKIAMKRAGATTVEVSAHGLSKKLSIKVVPYLSTLQAEITQQPVAQSSGRVEADHAAQAEDTRHGS